MIRVVRLLLAAFIGASLGLGSVYVALTDPRFDFAPTIGPWRVAVDAGGAARDPYSIARTARAGTLGLGPAEGVAFAADRDSSGRLLDPACHYVIEGPIPTADLWTLVVTDRAGRPPVNPAERIGFTNRDALRDARGRTTIGIGRAVRPGNFIPTGDLASLVVTLRIYAPGLAANLPGAAGLPQIRLAECAKVQS